MRALELLRELVAIPSPSGREHAVSDWCGRVMRAMGMPDVRRLSVPDSADTVVGRIEGRAEEGGLLLSFHIDTEDPHPDWGADAFSARHEQGRLYGPGAHDMKAGAAGLLAAVEALSAARFRGRGPLVLAATTDEIRWSRGAHALIRSGLLRGCRYALVGEPSPAFTFHDGARGRHIVVLRDRDWTDLPLPPGESVRRDGRAASFYVLPGRGAGDVVRDVRRAYGDDVAFTLDPRPTPAPPSYRVPSTSPFVRALRDAIEAETGRPARTCLAQNVSDANHYQAFAGLEALLYGPTGGNTDRPGEYVDADSLLQVTSVYRRVIEAMLG